MSQQIEQLKHGTTLIFPRTSQEAVLVIYKNKVQTLGDYINRTVITPNESPQNIKIQYNKQGEIINTKPVEKLNIFINGKNIYDVCNLSIKKCFDFMSKLKLTKEQKSSFNEISKFFCTSSLIESGKELKNLIASPLLR